MSDEEKEFIDKCEYFFKFINGKFVWPNSVEGDLLKIAYKIIKEKE